MNRIALVLPAYNAADDLAQTFDNVQRGIEAFPQHDFHVFITDDGSPDKGRTWEAINDLGSKAFGDAITPHQNSPNLGLVQTLKDAYGRALDHSFDPTHTLKTDTDRDFDQSSVLETLVPYTSSQADVVAGVRWRPITVQDHAYEAVRRADITFHMKRIFDLEDLDPVSCGSQLYTAETINSLLEHPSITAHTEKWGLDMHIPLVAQAEGLQVEVTPIENGSYDPSRRDPEKVKDQYDIYVEKIATLTGTSPEQVSGLYQLEPFAHVKG